MSVIETRAGGLAAAVVFISFLSACVQPPPPPPPNDQVERGRQIFFTETFDGNGRTCGTCHREEDNFGLTPNFIATLPADDPLFVAETNPDLASGFESPPQMRAHGLIRENLDGFEDLENKFTLRGVPHTQAMRASVASREGPHTGWSGDGSPGDGSLLSFAVGAVIQHFTKTTNRVAGTDFRLPTDEELDAIEAFMLATGRQEDLTLPLPLAGESAMRGQTVFLDNAVGRCNVCHNNAGANGDPAILGQGAGNLNFDTGVENLPNLPGREVAPRDDGRGIPGDGTFNIPPLVESADTGPFFHNNAVATIEEAVEFYNSDTFDASPAGQLIRQATGSGISLDEGQVRDIAAFLRVINALENIRQATGYLDGSSRSFIDGAERTRFLAGEEIDDAVRVLSEADLHADAIADLNEAKRLALKGRYYATRAIEALERARGRLLTSQ